MMMFFDRAPIFDQNSAQYLKLIFRTGQLAACGEGQTLAKSIHFITLISFSLSIRPDDYIFVLFRLLICNRRGSG